MKVDVSELAKLGFSNLEINCYDSLCNNGPAVASQLAKSVGHRPTSLYRALNRLEKRGFVASHRTDPGVTYYYSVPVEDALDHYFAWQRNQVLDIVRQQRRRHLL